jgi:hypothetical protein
VPCGINESQRCRSRKSRRKGSGDGREGTSVSLPIFSILTSLLTRALVRPVGAIGVGGKGRIGGGGG